MFPMYSVCVGQKVCAVTFLAKMLYGLPLIIGNAGMDDIPCVYYLLFGCALLAMLQYLFDKPFRIVAPTCFKLRSKCARLVISQAQDILYVIVRHELSKSLQTAFPIVAHQYTTKVKYDILSVYHP